MGLLDTFGDLGAPKDGVAVAVSRFDIPEPTHSLLWVTNENTDKAVDVGGTSIRIILSIGSEAEDNDKNFYSEPSLIWTKLPVQPNKDLEQSPMYYPSYTGLSPIHRFQYISWLEDVTKPTNLSYVFLYYYGLERHLLLGDYDMALKETLRLIKYHDKDKFRFYVLRPLITASLFRKRYDIFEKAPFLLSEISNEALAIKIAKNIPLEPCDLINMSSKVGFTNKRYIKKYPKLFEKILSEKMRECLEKEGDLFSLIDMQNIKLEECSIFLNLSIPDQYRNARVPQILESKKFRKRVNELLSNTHKKIRESTKGRGSRRIGF